jgi:N-acetylglucosaminyl-diphospho-decaprenol L-rhamnosyltransferase
MTWWDYDDERPVDQPMASAFLVRRSVLEEIGLMDEQFPIFFNDVDLCKRIWDAGREVWYTPHASMVHVGGASTGQVRRRMLIESHRSFVRFYRKHYRGKIAWWRYAGAVALLQVGYVLRLLLHDLRRLSP